MELTYGHAMVEYCYFRMHANDFIAEAVKAREAAKVSDVFNIMHTALKSSVTTPASQHFYIGKSAEKKRKKIIAALSDQIHREDNDKREDFNDWILGTKEEKGVSKENLFKRQLLAEHLLSLQRTAFME